MNVSPYKRFEKAFKEAYLTPLTLLRYGTRKPHRARLHGSPHWIYIDPEDPCAIKKVVHEPLRGKVSDNLVFWRDFSRQLQPDLIVDVGLNYGECLFGTDYPEKTRLYGFEANPRLIPHLERSRDEHPAAERIELHHCLVSDEPASEVPFLVNPDWSGSSSALPELNDRPESIEFKLDARPLDEVIPRHLAEGAKLLFKMDIEGFESKALRGFTATLDAVKMAVGFIEFDAQYLRWAGEQPDEYLRWLQQRFDLYRVASIKERILKPVERLDQLPKLHGDRERVHVDLVLASRRNPPGWRAPEWRVLS